MCYLAPICIYIYTYMYIYIYRNLVTYIDLPFTNLQVPFGISLSFALKLWGQRLYIFEQQTTASSRNPTGNAIPKGKVSQPQKLERRDACFSERERERENEYSYGSIKIIQVYIYQKNIIQGFPPIYGFIASP